MAFCTNCGTSVAEGQHFCRVCGHRVTSDSLLTPVPMIDDGSWSTTSSRGARVVIGLGARAPRQRRWSVLLRVVLGLPLIIWLAVITIAAVVTVIVAWFAALVNGEVPGAMQRFLTDVARYNAKVEAYLSLLTDRWPGLSLQARPHDQVSLEIDHVRLNRAAVLFRAILAIPAGLVASVLSLGAYLLTFVMWISALILGRVPQALHEARGQVWRFTIRSSAYIELLTPTQPFEGFFGDAPAADTGSGDDSVTGLSTTSPLSRWGRIFFIVTLLSGVYLQTQPSVLRWPTAYVLDRAVGPTFITAINQNIVVDLENYVAGSTNGCSSDAPGGCPVVAATAQIDVARQLSTLHSFQTFVVEGRQEYLTYVSEVLKIDLTLQQAANASAGEYSTYAALVTNEMGVLHQSYLALHQAL